MITTTGGTVPVVVVVVVDDDDRVSLLLLLLAVLARARTRLRSALAREYSFVPSPIPNKEEEASPPLPETRHT